MCVCVSSPVQLQRYLFKKDKNRDKIEYLLRSYMLLENKLQKLSVIWRFSDKGITKK